MGTFSSATDLDVLAMLMEMPCIDAAAAQTKCMRSTDKKGGKITAILSFGARPSARAGRTACNTILCPVRMQDMYLGSCRDCI
eukprot:6179941-Pleurochrysis_carterae.AAC.1